MNRNLFPKRKCNSSPGAVNVPGGQRAEQYSAANHEDPKDTKSTKRVSIRTRVIVSISYDMEFDRRLRMLAMQTGQIVIRVESVDDALRIVDANCCGIILLDLDSMGRTALELAGDLLRDPLCPPVILLTGKGEQLDLRMTVFAGSVLEKSTDTYRILNLLKTILEGWSSGADRAPLQRGIIQWEESSDGPVPRAPAKRYWGINE
jgi:CheY-like chemotaxis protein